MDFQFSLHLRIRRSYFNYFDLLFHSMVSLRVTLILILSVIFVAPLCGQKIPLINSGEVIKQGIVLYDSGKYEEAIDLYKTISPRDTNYVYMLTELAITYNAAKKYDEAISACEEALKNPGEHKPHLLSSLGTAYDHKGDFEKSVATYESALKEFPFNHLLHYNLGVTYGSHEDYEKASECFMNALWINPFHAGSHFALGRISALQGKKVRAMMSLGIYLAINNSDNDRLVFLERFLNNEITEEGSIEFKGNNPFEKLDQIIRAKIVTDKKFKAKVPVNAILVRQYQLLLEQLSLAENSPDDFWIKFYLPLYKSIQEKELLEPFLYHILSSASNPDVAKWRKKNDKKLNEFFSLAGVKLKENRATRILPDDWGFENPVPCWYGDKNYLDAIGHKDSNGTRYGKWKFFNNNGYCTAEGSYDRTGKKIGTWKYYHDNGILKSVENNETGEIQAFNEYGEPLHHYFLKDDKISGDVELFYPCGTLSEKLTYNEGKRDGAGKTFYKNGHVNIEYRYKADKFDGEYVVYFEDGKVMRKYLYKEGMLDGPYLEYYGNGKIKTRGIYKEDKADGLWQYYYMNGRLEKSGYYKTDLLSGEWTLYDVRGQLYEKQNYDDKGQLHGEDIQYRSGEKDYINRYEHGLLVELVYFDRKGNELGRFGDPSGTFTAKGYYADGQLRFEGAYLKGKANGEWKYYYREGQLHTKYTYKDGAAQGDYIEYFQSGEKKVEQVFKDDNLDGYYTEYYRNGQVQEEGWYQNGQRQQQFLSYYPDGTLLSDAYYLNGNLTGASLDYNIDGKVYLSNYYRDTRITAVSYFDDKGKVRLGKELSGKREELLQKFPSGKDHTRIEMTCGEYSGEILKWWPDGKQYSVISVSDGKRHGKYQFYYSNGQPDLAGQYIYGDEAGKWIWYYENGKKYSEGYYLKGERDSTWTYFNEEGKVSSKRMYANGDREGVSQYFSPEGILIMEKLFENGDVVAYRTLTKDGKLTDWKTFKGNETVEAYFANGNKAFEERYKNGLLDGIQRSYYFNGQLHYEYHFSAGDFEGDFVEYYGNGKLKEKGSYKYDELDGVVAYYNPDETLHRTETYKGGMKNGSVTFYDKGLKKNEVKFWAGYIVE